ncbi:hypothetical protein L6273_02690 [Candidatus Parcubacteria bacterium]|nr:hypothetical protein [Candidatus Parcubacteria bacterium]
MGTDSTNTVGLWNHPLFLLEIPEDEEKGQRVGGATRVATGEASIWEILDSGSCLPSNMGSLAEPTRDFEEFCMVDEWYLVDHCTGVCLLNSGARFFKNTVDVVQEGDRLFLLLDYQVDVFVLGDSCDSFSRWNLVYTRSASGTGVGEDVSSRSEPGRRRAPVEKGLVNVLEREPLPF